MVNTLQTILIKIDYMRKCECNLNIGERQNRNDERQGVSKNLLKIILKIYRDPIITDAQEWEKDRDEK